MKSLHRILSRIPQRAPATCGQNPPGTRAPTHPCRTASLRVAPRANSAAIALSSRLARPAPRHSGGFVHGLLGVAALAGGCATEPQLPVPATITVFPESATLLWVGDTVRLAANVWPVEWTSDDESVVTVDSAGVVTAVGKGVASVRGAVGEVEGLATITVNPDRSVLVEIHEALGGSGWRRDDNWGTDAPLDKWYGVTTDSEGNVQALRLQANRLSGTIPPAIGHLGALDTLKLFWNDLTGPVPPELGNLRQLRLLSLGWNDLTGPVPPELGNLQALEGLYLNDNSLTGPSRPNSATSRNLNP